jgi:hypothetical protein
VAIFQSVWGPPGLHAVHGLWTRVAERGGRHIENTVFSR